MLSDDGLAKSRRHVHIYDEDWDLLQQLYGLGSPSKIGASEAVRRLIHKACVKMRSRMQDAADEAEDYHEEAEVRTVQGVDI